MQKFGKLLILCLLIAAAVVTGAEARVAGRMRGAMESAALCGSCSLSSGMCKDNGCANGGLNSCSLNKGGTACVCFPVVD